MGKDPDQLTDDIAATRERMSETVDEVRTRVSPSQAIQRRTDSARAAVRDGGTAVAERTQDMAEDASRGGRRVMHAVTDTARDKPLITGAAAFGAGLLLGVLAPASDTERRAARRVQGDLQEPVREAIGESARHVGDEVGERASEAREHIVDEARHATGLVGDEAREAAESARDRARQASDDVREEIQRDT